MHMRCLNLLILLTVFVFAAIPARAQEFRLHGKITNSRLEPLALVSVQVKDSRLGAVTGEDGTWSLMLDEGTHQLAISMMGFRSTVVSVVVRKGDSVQNLILEEDEVANLSEVVIKGKAKDRSKEILRQVILHKEANRKGIEPYSVSMYIKAVQEDSAANPNKKKRKPLPGDTLGNPNADLTRMAMAEILVRYDHESARKTREERMAVKKRGPADDLFYLSTTEGGFDFYDNLLNVPALSVTPFLSPISYSGLAAYRTKVTSTTVVRGHKVYTISIKPGKLSNATMEGEVVIEDSSWSLLHTDLALPDYHLAAYDYFQVKQDYMIVGTVYVLAREQFTYYTKRGKGKKSGTTVVSFRDYELNKRFEPGYFGPEVSKVSAEAYDRDTAFWQQARTEPLTAKEIRFIRYKDSIYTATHSKVYLDSIDAVTNRVTLKKLLFTGQPMYNREKGRLWQFPAFFSIAQPLQFGGFRLMPQVYFEKVYASKRAITVATNLSYGFRNRDLNGSINFRKMYNPFNRAYFTVGLGREFNYIYNGDAWINLIKRSNFYLNNAIGLGHGRELVNGLFISADLDIAFRRSLSNYKTKDNIDSLLNLRDNIAPPFTSYNAAYGKLELRYTPFQRYIREPKEKIILGSYWPTVYAQYRKGIPGLFSSDVDFDYLEFGLQQTLKLGLAGVSSYTLRTGDFLNTKDLRLIDYKFERRGDPLLFLNPNEAFQMLDSTFPVFHRFYELHYVHEFNGAILNKIPLFKKLGLREIVGGGLLSAPERKLHYGELFAGVERVFRAPFNIPQKFKLGVYAVGSVANQFKNPVQFKLGITTWDKKRGRWF